MQVFNAALNETMAGSVGFLDRLETKKSNKNSFKPVKHAAPMDLTMTSFSAQKIAGNQMSQTQRNKTISWAMTLPEMRKTHVEVSPKNNSKSPYAESSMRTIDSDQRKQVLEERLKVLQNKHSEIIL